MRAKSEFVAKDNPYVSKGDFHALQYSDGSLQAVYVNCLDHAFDLDKILNEVRRVLKTGGFFIADILYGYNEGFSVGNYDAMHWDKARNFADHLSNVSGLKIVTFRDLAKQRRSIFWTQCVMIKS